MPKKRNKRWLAKLNSAEEWGEKKYLDSGNVWDSIVAASSCSDNFIAPFCKVLLLVCCWVGLSDGAAGGLWGNWTPALWETNENFIQIIMCGNEIEYSQLTSSPIPFPTSFIFTKTKSYKAEEQTQPKYLSLINLQGLLLFNKRQAVSIANFVWK